MEVRLRCSDNNALGGALGWGFVHKYIFEDGDPLDPGLLSQATIPICRAPRFECYSSESNSSLEGFWATAWSEDEGGVIRKPITGVNLTEWHVYSINWDKGNTTFFVNGIPVAFIDRVPRWDMGVWVYLQNKIYNPDQDIPIITRRLPIAVASNGSLIKSIIDFGLSNSVTERSIQIDYIDAVQGLENIPEPTLLPILSILGLILLPILIKKLP
jgi:hypothetical protein